MALQARLCEKVCHTLAPVVCTRGIQKQSRLHKLCNFTGPQDRDDDGWIKIIGYYGKDNTPHVGNVVKVCSEILSSMFFFCRLSVNFRLSLTV